MEPLRSGFRTSQAPREVLCDVWSLSEDVCAQELADGRVPSFDAPVAATDAVAAEHHEIRSNVVAGMFEDVVKREPEPLEASGESDAVTENALLPLVMERLQKRPITNATLRLRIRSHRARARPMVASTPHLVNKTRARSFSSRSRASDDACRW